MSEAGDGLMPGRDHLTHLLAKACDDRNARAAREDAQRALDHVVELLPSWGAGAISTTLGGLVVMRGYIRRGGIMEEMLVRMFPSEAKALAELLYCKAEEASKC